MDAVLVPLTRSPRLPKCIGSPQELLAKESVERQRFRDRLDEDKKAEFINGADFLHSPAKLERTETQKLILVLLNTYVTMK